MNRGRDRGVERQALREIIRRVDRVLSTRISSSKAESVKETETVLVGRCRHAWRQLAPLLRNSLIKWFCATASFD